MVHQCIKTQYSVLRPQDLDLTLKNLFLILDSTIPTSSLQIIHPPFFKQRKSQSTFNPYFFRFLGGEVTVSRTCGSTCASGRVWVWNDVSMGQAENLCKDQAYFVFREGLIRTVMKYLWERLLQACSKGQDGT